MRKTDTGGKSYHDNPKTSSHRYAKTGKKTAGGATIYRELSIPPMKKTKTKKATKGMGNMGLKRSKKYRGSY